VASVPDGDEYLALVLLEGRAEGRFEAEAAVGALKLKAESPREGGGLRGERDTTTAMLETGTL